MKKRKAYCVRINLFNHFTLVSIFESDENEFQSDWKAYHIIDIFAAILTNTTEPASPYRCISAFPRLDRHYNGLIRPEKFSYSIHSIRPYLAQFDICNTPTVCRYNWAFHHVSSSERRLGHVAQLDHRWVVAESSVEGRGCWWALRSQILSRILGRQNRMNRLRLSRFSD